MSTDELIATPTWPLWVSAALLMALAGALALLPELRGFFVDGWETLTSGDSARIRSWVAGFAGWGALVIVVLMVLQMFLVVVPSWLLMVIAVLAYGPWWGGALSVLAVGVASTLGYGLGTLLGEHGLERLVKRPTLEKIEREAERYGLWAVVIARLNPLISNDVISLVAGLLRMGYGRFLIATLTGILPLTAAIAAFGRDWERMKGGMLWLSLASLAGLAVKVWLDRRRSA